MKKSIRNVLLFYLIMLILSNIIIYLSSPIKPANFGVPVFFHLINVNLHVLFLIVYSLLFPFVTLMKYFEYHNNGFANLMICRIGRKKYYTTSLIKIFMTYTILTLGLYVLLLLDIHYLWSPVSLVEQKHIAIYFSYDITKNLVVFLTLSSIGSGIYACFLFSLIHYCKNKYVFAVSMILNTFIGVLFTVIVGSMIQRVSIPLSYFTMPSGLFAVGTAPDEELGGYINFISCAIFYITLTVILLRYAYKQEECYG